MKATWRIELLDGLRVQHGDETLTRLRIQSVAHLLAYLAYFPGRLHPREVLIDLLWPGCPTDKGRSRLSVTLTMLRRVLDTTEEPAASLLVTDRFGVQLDSQSLSTDVAQFEKAIHLADTSPFEQRGTHLRRAVELYPGPLLPGSYEDWIIAERERLVLLHFHALRRLTLWLEQSGDLRGALNMGEEVGSEMRYQMLETLREFGWEQLTEEERTAVRHRHRDYFLLLAEASDAYLQGPEQAEWFERMETEHDNLRAALDWCLEDPQGAEAGLRMAGELHYFWLAHGHYSEGR